MLRSTCTFFGASSAALAAWGRAERGQPRPKPPSITTAVSSAVVRSLVGRIIFSLLSFHDDDGVHLVGVQAAGDGIGAGRDGRGLVVVAGAAQPAGRTRTARPFVTRGDQAGARRPRLGAGDHGTDVGVGNHVVVADEHRVVHGVAVDEGQVAAGRYLDDGGRELASGERHLDLAGGAGR